jgi:hypothetical protein
MSWIGLDVGGANLKAADGLGWARSVPFALWRDPSGLASALAALLRDAPNADRLAVTMTGELCDCFESKSAGVHHILDAVEAVAEQRKVAVYLVDGRFVTCDEARQSPRLAAASNWHALARFACRYVLGASGLVIDVGSTTTDIIPIAGGEVAARGRTDTERLIHRELVYTGVGRTPICAVVRSLPIGGRDCPIATELFATTADAYVILAELGEDPDANWTADGRGLIKELAKQRLARMVCADACELDGEEFERMASAIRDSQCVELESAVEVVIGLMSRPPSTVVVSGAGDFLARAVLKRHFSSELVISLSQELGCQLSRCAPAHAVAVIAQESG